MIQATGLTKTYRRGRSPALIDLTFDAPPGQVTVLLGPGGAGKSTAVRLLLGLEDGRGTALFGGRPFRGLHRPERRVGVVLQHRRPVGHPRRRALGHLRMLAAAAGVPARRADQLLEQTRLTAVSRHRLRTLSPGAERRLALAAALLGDPEILLLDGPTEGLSPHDTLWFRAFLRAFAASGGTVLVTCSDPAEAAALGDRVITLDRGRTVADQPVGEFVRDRLRPEVTVRGPQAGRLADLLLEHGAEVRREDGTGIAVSGLARSEIGEIAYRHGILLHELADRIAEQPAPQLPVLASDAVHRPRVALPADPEETVVVLRPGAAVAATVVAPLHADRGLARVPDPPCPGATDPMPSPSRPEPSAALTPWSE
ncbi:ATP-binding cassette domain-containing protein [Peterkaempfera griseoplana]|uniref:ATP-binding cassette domain-containing protein n=1 Tax=Peterkaempfera griseoplana TaxID=66896 RepID=UPI0006E16F17|nr:ABC transporter ATP-binding protein [Peterkaempfera griseoplana]